MLEIDWNFIVVFALVWILVLVLSRVFFKPILGVREKRKKIINENEKIYEQSLKEYENHLTLVENKLREARQESQSIRQKMVSEALAEKSKLTQDVQIEVQGQVEKVKKELQDEV
ncbi:MAG TPA: ATP synthase F0 subunit B, partial [Candidatus Saccharicenans sp.]|nr:ATP synthase F0 subunit B [Candidatus Saccharicenans sp.]